MRFLKRINFLNVFDSHTNEWSVPEGIFRSLGGPNFNLFFEIYSGMNFFPVEYSSDQDFMNVQSLDKTFLLNPPYSKSNKCNYTIYDFLKKTIILSEERKKIQILILPKRENTVWFKDIMISASIGIIELKNNLFFTHGSNNALFQRASFKSILVFIGMNFSYTTVKNNSFGNFFLPKKWGEDVIDVYNNIDFTNKRGY